MHLLRGYGAAGFVEVPGKSGRGSLREDRRKGRDERHGDGQR
jgi:hypothetical protein